MNSYVALEPLTTWRSECMCRLLWLGSKNLIGSSVWQHCYSRRPHTTQVHHLHLCSLDDCLVQNCFLLQSSEFKSFSSTTTEQETSTLQIPLTANGSLASVITFTSDEHKVYRRSMPPNTMTKIHGSRTENWYICIWSNTLSTGGGMIHNQEGNHHVIPGNPSKSLG
jgi:hypothetical protein